MENIDRQQIKGIIFDYGGTIDSRGNHWSHIIEKAYSDAGLSIDHDKFRDAYIIGERTLGRERIILPMDNFLTLLEKKIKIQIARLTELGELDASALSDGTSDRVAHLCYEAARECVNESAQTIEALYQKYPLVLVSNFYGNIEEVLRDFGIRRFFRGIIESAVVGIRKPDPRIFLLGTTVLGLKPEEVLVIGDSLNKDILPAREIGCKTAWLKGKGWTDEEDSITDPAQINGLKEIEAVLI